MVFAWDVLQFSVFRARSKFGPPVTASKMLYFQPASEMQVEIIRTKIFGRRCSDMVGPARREPLDEARRIQFASQGRRAGGCG